MNRPLNPVLVVLVAALAGMWVAGAVFTNPGRGDARRPVPTFTGFLGELEQGELREVVLRTRDNSAGVTSTEGPPYEVGYPPEYAGEPVERLRSAEVQFDVEPRGSSALAGVLRLALPVALFVGVWLLFVRRRAGTRRAGRRIQAGAGPGALGRRAADDIRRRRRGRRGAGGTSGNHRVPRGSEPVRVTRRADPEGVLLSGPPGTGKTRPLEQIPYARCAHAYEHLHEVRPRDREERHARFAGHRPGEQRPRRSRPRTRSPALAASGRQRGAGVGGGNDEREQTLNQLLVEMDGFEPSARVIVIAATNRPDVLDPALLRPGRFDREVVVDRPDRAGRREILKVHTRAKPVAAEVDLDALAGQTAGFTGADLPNLVNEAALLAERNTRTRIAQPELEEGIMRVVAGPERRSRVLSERERRVTAYHELGHAIVGHYLEHSDPVHRISIISRGHALGYTISLPTEDRLLTTKAQLNDTSGNDARRPRGGAAHVRRAHHRRVGRPREGDRDGQADGDALRHEREARAAGLRPRPCAAVPRAAAVERAGHIPTRSRARSTSRYVGSSMRRTSGPR